MSQKLPRYLNKCCRLLRSHDICSKFTKRRLHCRPNSHLGSKQVAVLGIESSCDDTGAAIVDQNGRILGEALHSQTKIHVEVGGIIPPVARDLHKEHIKRVVDSALEQAGMSIHDVDAVATTVKPGLIMSLDIGMKHTKILIEISSVPFPFLVLLMSGGHCLLAVAQNVDDFLLLGQTTDIAPGDTIDKVARALSLKDLPTCAGLSGGQSVDITARAGDPRTFQPIPKINRHRDCDFSFSGARTAFERIIEAERRKYGLEATAVLPNAPDICASLQLFLLKQIANRVQRAITFCDQRKLIDGQNRTLVLSGGVASNSFLRAGLKNLSDHNGFKLICPPPKLCTDNGVMIAWNGIEKYKLDRGFADISTVDIQARSPFGKDISSEVAAAEIKGTRLKFPSR